LNGNVISDPVTIETFQSEDFQNKLNNENNVENKNYKYVIYCNLGDKSI